eukprot:TCONS_00022792-protein
MAKEKDATYDQKAYEEPKYVNGTLPIPDFDTFIARTEKSSKRWSHIKIESMSNQQEHGILMYKTEQTFHIAKAKAGCEYKIPASQLIVSEPKNGPYRIYKTENSCGEAKRF